MIVLIELFPLIILLPFLLHFLGSLKNVYSLPFSFIILEIDAAFKFLAQNVYFFKMSYSVLTQI